MSRTPFLNTVRTGPRKGNPVVFVHALGLDLTLWDRQIEALCDTFDVVAFDLPGHGRSEGHPSLWSLETVTKVLADVIRSTDSSAAHVVGLSVGSMIAQALALKFPELVKSLTLIGSAATFTPESRQYLLGQAALTDKSGMAGIIESSMPYWFAPGTRARRPDILDRTAKTLLRTDPKTHAAVWQMVSTYDLENEISGIQRPTMLLVGQEDLSTPPIASEQIARRVQGSTLHVIPDAAHMLPLEQPQAVSAHLLRFLNLSDEASR